MKVFISHAFVDDDKKLVSELQTILIKQGIEGYLAEQDPQFGKRLDEKIEKKISDSDCLVAIYTKDAKGSASVAHEIGYARGRHIRIIIMLERGITLPVLISQGEAEEFTRENFSEHCKRVRAFLLGEGVKIKYPPISAHITTDTTMIRLVLDCPECPKCGKSLSLTCL